MSNILPPYRKYNYKITLTKPLPNSFSPLYRQSTAKLQLTKEYLLENLAKGFIINLNNLFASPVLFVKKLGLDKLRFYINFKKLNTLIKNNLYLILRINKLLTKISKAKVFTKLDIR